MFKNTAGQKATFFAFNTTTNAPVTGDAANITAYVSIDHGSVTALTDTSAAEKDSTNAKGYYTVDLTQGETNGDSLNFTAKSSTSNVVVIGVPAVVFPYPTGGFGTAQTGDSFARIGATGSGLTSLAPSATALSTAQWTNTRAGYLDNINNSTLPNAVFPTDPADASVLAGLIAGLDTKLDTIDNFVDTEIGTIITHLTDIKGATFSGSTDSLEAIRDRGDAAWITATGFSTHSAGDVWAVGTRVLTAGTNIVLPSNGLSAISAWTVNITGSLSGSVGSVTGAVGSVTGAVGSVAGNVTGSVGSLAAQAKADVNAEVLDVMNVDTHAEPGQGAPPATASIFAKINYLFKQWRNKKTQTSTESKLFGDDGTTVDQKATVSDDGSTATSGEVGTGP